MKKIVHQYKTTSREREANKNPVRQIQYGIDLGSTKVLYGKAFAAGTGAAGIGILKEKSFAI